MRINVYAEEITHDVTFITKTVDGRRFYGIRMFLKSPADLHNSVEDDDRSAITFWVPWYDGQNHHGVITVLFEKLKQAAFNANRDDFAKGKP